MSRSMEKRLLAQATPEELAAALARVTAERDALLLLWWIRRFTDD